MDSVAFPVPIVVKLSGAFLRSRKFPVNTPDVVTSAVQAYASGLWSDLRLPATPFVRVEEHTEDAAFRVVINGQDARALMLALYPPPTIAPDAHQLARQIALTIYRNRELTVTTALVAALQAQLGAGDAERAPASESWVRACGTLLAGRGLAPSRLADLAMGKGETPSSPAEVVDELTAALSTYRLKLFHSGSQPERVVSALEREREQVFVDLGVLAPAIELEQASGLGPSEWQMQVNDVRLPAFAGEAPRSLEEVRAELKRHAPALLSRRALELLLDLLRQDWEFVVNAGVARVGLTGILSVLRGLVTEDLPIRDLPTILDALASITAVTGRNTIQTIVFGPNTGGLAYTDAGRGLGELTVSDYEACVRIWLAGQVSYKHASGGRMTCLLLSTTLEEQLLTMSESSDARPNAVPIVRKIWEAFQEHRSTEHLVLLTSVDVRRKVRELIREEIPELPVVCYQELSPDLSITPLSRIS